MDYTEKLAWLLEYDLPILPLHNVEEDGSCSCRNPACKAIAKHPRTLHGWKDASRNPVQIEQWHRLFPRANWAVALGEISNLCCVDIDPRNRGLESLGVLFPDGLPADTLTVRTGRIDNVDTDMAMGFHYYFLLDPLYAESVKNLLPGIDFLANGSYTVTPPSVHYTGGEYKVINDSKPQPLLESVKKLLREKLRDPQSHVKIDWKQTLYEGERDVALTQLAGKLIYSGMDESDTYMHIRVHNDSLCVPPLEEEEITKIVSSIWRTDQEKKARLGEKKAEKSEKAKSIGIQAGFTLLKYTTGYARYGVQQVEWLIEGFLPRQAIVFALAPPGCYKTWMQDYLHYSLATGNPFLGHYPVNQVCDSLKINYEDHPGQFYQRLDLIGGTEPQWSYDLKRGTVGYCEYPAGGQDYRIWTPDPETCPILNFTDRESVHWFERDIMQQQNNRLISLDPLYFLVPSTDNFQAAPYHMQVLKRWRLEYDCTFVIVHHMRKNPNASGRMRDDLLGSQLLNAFAETTWSSQPIDETRVRFGRTTKTGAPLPELEICWNISNYSVNVEIDLYKAPQFPIATTYAKPNGQETGQKAVSPQELFTPVTEDVETPVYGYKMERMKEQLEQTKKTRLDDKMDRMGFVRHTLETQTIYTWRELEVATGILYSTLHRRYKGPLKIVNDPLQAGRLICMADPEIYDEEEDVREEVS